MINRRYQLLVIIMVLAFSLFGQSNFENNLILEINVNGNINIDEELIYSVLSFEVGDILEKDDVSQSIKNLCSGIFFNVYFYIYFIINFYQFVIIVEVDVSFLMVH